MDVTTEAGIGMKEMDKMVKQEEGGEAITEEVTKKTSSLEAANPAGESERDLEDAKDAANAALKSNSGDEIVHEAKVKEDVQPMAELAGPKTLEQVTTTTPAGAKTPSGENVITDTAAAHDDCSNLEEPETRVPDAPREVQTTTFKWQVRSSLD